MISDLLNIDPGHLHSIGPAMYAAADDPGHPPRILILHGSVRARSYSRGVGDEAERLLRWFGAEVRRCDPSGLPLPKLVIAGKQAIENDVNATGQMLAALLGWSQATFATKLEVDGDAAKVTREMDGGLQTIQVKLPPIVTADLRLKEPRYASLPNIMKAKKKPLDEKTADDYGIDVPPRLEMVKTREPEGRSAGIRVGSAAKNVHSASSTAGLFQGPGKTSPVSSGLRPFT